MIGIVWRAGREAALDEEQPPLLRLLSDVSLTLIMLVPFSIASGPPSRRRLMWSSLVGRSQERRTDVRPAEAASGRRQYWDSAEKSPADVNRMLKRLEFLFGAIFFALCKRKKAVHRSRANRGRSSLFAATDFRHSAAPVRLATGKMRAILDRRSERNGRRVGARKLLRN
jgi:hypothetical protein